MTVLARIVFGSHLYGTETKYSDRDWKAIVLPPAEDILLQRVRNAHRHSTKVNTSYKNSNKDVETESWALHHFFKLLAEGHPAALDTLFAPHWAHNEKRHQLWIEIEQNRHRLISKKGSVFIGYCKQQAAKYGLKGTRVAAMEAASRLLLHLYENYHAHCKLQEFPNHLKDLTAYEYIEIVDIENPGGVVIPHLKVCETKVPLTISLKQAQEIYVSAWNKFGDRARAAQANEDVDWKAMSHAVRVGRQSLELLRRGRITFPRPEAEHLVEIKTGKLPYAQVAEEIEYLIERIKEVEKVSLLPTEPDLKWMEQKTLEAYEMQVSTSRSLPKGPGKIYQIPIGETRLPHTLVALLEANKIKTTGDLAWKSVDEVCRIKGLGKKKFNAIVEELERYGTKIGALLERQANAPHPGMASPRGRKRTRPGYRPVYGASKAKLQALHPRT
jgi:hypothetical protein